VIRTKAQPDDFSAEIQSHLQLEIERLQEEGLTLRGTRLLGIPCRFPT
jgi:hypothetical protein